MKKVMFVLVLMAMGVGAMNAQKVFRSRIEFDKYDDVVSYRECRLLYTEKDDEFVFDVKNEGVKVYKRVGQKIYTGSREDVQELAGSKVYGYDMSAVCEDEDRKLWLLIYRVISSSQYVFYYETEMLIMYELDSNGYLTGQKISYGKDYDKDMEDYIKSLK